MNDELVDVANEVKYWITAIAIGDLSGSLISATGDYHNFDHTIPYLIERPLVHQIPKRYNVKSSTTTTTTTFMRLTDVAEDELLHIFSFLDCRSLLMTSSSCTLFYHVARHNVLWSHWLNLEVVLKSKKQRQTTTGEEGGGAVNEEALQEKVQEELFFTFYRPTAEEAIYNQYKQELLAYHSQLESHLSTTLSSEQEVRSDTAGDENDDDGIGFTEQAADEETEISYTFADINSEPIEQDDNYNLDNYGIDPMSDANSSDDEEAEEKSGNAEANPKVGKQHWWRKLADKIHERRMQRLQKRQLARDLILRNFVNRDDQQVVNQTAETDQYTAYLTFRAEKIQNPFIRSKLIKSYVRNVRGKYARLFDTFPTVKSFCSFMILGFLVLLGLRLDKFINWPWVIVLAPLLIANFLSVLISIGLWIPTLHWPLVLYRWIAQDCVGWWTSWAYCFTKRGRLVQLLFFVSLSLIPYTICLSHIFPRVVPIWLGAIISIASFTFWTYNGTQIIFSEAKKRHYGVLLFLFGSSMVLFSIVISFKLIVPFLRRRLPWGVTFIPFYAALFLFSIFAFKLNSDLNRASKRHCMCIVWNALFVFGLLDFLVCSCLLLVLKLDKVIRVPYTVLFIPLFLLFILLNVYYLIRATTKTRIIKQTALKNPLTLLTGGVKNAGTMDTFVV